MQGAEIVFADVDWARIGETPFGTGCDIHGNYFHSAPVSALGAWTNLPPAFVSPAQGGLSHGLIPRSFRLPRRGKRIKIYGDKEKKDAEH